MEEKTSRANLMRESGQHGSIRTTGSSEEQIEGEGRREREGGREGGRERKEKG